MPNRAKSPRCSECGLRNGCLAAGLNEDEVALLDRWLCAGPAVAAGDYLYWSGDSSQGLYAVQSGCLKSFTTDLDGNERVRGFHMAGDLVGLDALWKGAHGATAQAVTAVTLCRLPSARIDRASAELGGLRRRLFGLLSRDLAAALTRAGEFTAEQRLAAFLLDIAARPAAAAGDEVRLPMGRRDIANYLRLATETVSRVLTRFRQRGLIEVEGHKVRLLQPEALEALAAELGQMTAAETAPTVADTAVAA